MIMIMMSREADDLYLRLWLNGKIPFTFHQTLREIPYRNGFLVVTNKLL